MLEKITHHPGNYRTVQLVCLAWPATKIKRASQLWLGNSWQSLAIVIKKI